MKRFSGRFWTTIVAAMIVAMVSQMAFAQRDQGGRGRGRGGPGGAGGPGGPRGMSMGQLLMADEVQKALKLTDEQKTKIKAVFEDMRKSFADRGGPESFQKLRETTAKKINDVLDDGQRKRLMGILIQVQGAGAVNDPAVAKELNITDEQKKKLEEARPSFRPMREGGEAGGQNAARGSREEMQAKMEKAREQSNKMIMDILTPEQQKKLESLKGEKVDIDLSKLRGPGGQSGRSGRGSNRPNRGADQPKSDKST
jgi:Spy/CpxP family protein refolding chaperone